MIASIGMLVFGLGFYKLITWMDKTQAKELRLARAARDTRDDQKGMVR